MFGAVTGQSPPPPAEEVVLPALEELPVTELVVDAPPVDDAAPVAPPASLERTSTVSLHATTSTEEPKPTKDRSAQFMEGKSGPPLRAAQQRLQKGARFDFEPPEPSD